MPVPLFFYSFKGRSNLPHGPFWWPKMGHIANYIVIIWTIISLVFYSFHYYLPVVANEMKYLSAVLVAVFLYAGGYWLCYSCKHYELVDTHVSLE